MPGPKRFSIDYWMAKAFSQYLRATVSPPRDLDAVPGYLHPTEGLFLHWLAKRLPPGSHILEVGSFKGKSSCYIASGLTAAGSRLHCVDVFRNQAMPYDPPQDVFPEFEANVKRYRDVIDVHRGESTAVASDWALSLDALFIDGDHSYEGCRTDIDAWLPHVKTGGWVTFHDSWEAGVQRACAERFPADCRSRGIHARSIFATRKR